MKTILSPLVFDWDEGNSEKNKLKHRVSVQEAEEVFINQPFVVHDDELHSLAEEKRFHGLGQTNFGRKLFVAFTIRNRKIRVISVRDMNRKEGKSYERVKKYS